MLTTETKRHIDAARQVLVGVVPNPSSQIDQITNALIYKFMDDMDQMAIKAGGKASFFTGDLERYAWTRLMDTRLGSQERLNLYTEALTRFSEAKQFPELFRDIFRRAFLPYRIPEVLDLFLKEIAYFDYSHSEELGNAFEYLLSIMGSQGDAGQFRTPRHIIDFIVDVVDPDKSDRILDPACGTAGFLISAYKHILAKHDGRSADGTKNSEKPLSASDKVKLTKNFEGYDVSPDMVRLSKVNMYLHRFTSPNIFDYNTLAQEERWGDKFDVILANPPFMTPKGGMKTHNRFSVKATKSEVLFVDYIMSHLRPKGRAGIIVPEGIIFKSDNATTQLRKALVEDGLFAVVSLPSGVFNPYAGVKTSVLFFDTEMGKGQKEILFVKIENDGYDLGAQRRPIDGSNLPEAAEILKAWRAGKKKESRLAHWVKRKVIAETGDYNLSGDRFASASRAVKVTGAWPIVELEEICEINPKKTEVKNLPLETEVSFVPMADVLENQPTISAKQKKSLKEVFQGYTYFKDGDVLLAKVSPCFENGKAGIASNLWNGVGFGSSEFIVIRASKKIHPELVYYYIASGVFRDAGKKQMTGTGGLQRVPINFVRKYKIPLPPLEIQEQIVAELDDYQNIISGAKQIAENWKPKIDIDPEWKKVKLEEVCLQVTDGTHNSPNYTEAGVPMLDSKDIEDGKICIDNARKFISKETDEELSKRCKPRVGDVLVSSRGSIGKLALVQANQDFNIMGNIILLRPSQNLISEYLYYVLAFIDLEKFANGVAQKGLYLGKMKDIKIPFPPIEIQKQIVEKIEAERALVESSKKLVEIYEQKTKDIIAKLWNE